MPPCLTKSTLKVRNPTKSGLEVRSGPAKSGLEVRSGPTKSGLEVRSGSTKSGLELRSGQFYRRRRRCDKLERY